MFLKSIFWSAFAISCIFYLALFGTKNTFIIKVTQITESFADVQILHSASVPVTALIFS